VRWGRLQNPESTARLPAAPFLPRHVRRGSLANSQCAAEKGHRLEALPRCPDHESRVPGFVSRKAGVESEINPDTWNSGCSAGTGTGSDAAGWAAGGEGGTRAAAGFEAAIQLLAPPPAGKAENAARARMTLKHCTTLGWYLCLRAGHVRQYINAMADAYFRYL
jgi:hypothetical protein